MTLSDPWKTGGEGSFFQADLHNNFRTIWHRMTKFGRITQCGEGHRSWGQPRLPSQECGVPSIPNFVVLLLLHPLTQNDQIRHDNAYGERRVFRRLATSLHLHKCDARFVSDSWVSCLFYRVIRQADVQIYLDTAMTMNSDFTPTWAASHSLQPINPHIRECRWHSSENSYSNEYLVY